MNRASCTVGKVFDKSGKPVERHEEGLAIIGSSNLYALVRDRLEGEDDKDILWDDEITKRLADFQKVAVRQAVQIVKDY